MPDASPDPKDQIQPLLRLAQGALRMAPADLAVLQDLPPEERESILTPFLMAREEAREQAQSLAASGRLTREGLQAALDICLALAGERPLLAGELALLTGTAALGTGGPPEAVAWALALWDGAGPRGLHPLPGVAVDILGYAFESVDQGEACARLAERAANAAMEAGWHEGAVYGFRWARAAYADSGLPLNAAECDFQEARLHAQRGDSAEAEAATKRGQETLAAGEGTT